MNNPAETNHDINDLLKNRWSPRAFSNQPVEPEKLLSLFEAARWSPSGGNSQPWAYIVATKEDTEAHQKLVQTLMGFNTVWAVNAPVLVLTLAYLNPQRPGAGHYGYYDLGQAVAHLSVQAAELGLHTHQMAGFDKQKTRELFDIPADFEPMTVVALGYFGKLEDLPQELREREIAPRTRKPLDQFVFGGHWDEPLSQSLQTVPANV
jgi:nitroreductase